MATLSDYETALDTCASNPTPANAAAAANVHALLPEEVSADGVKVKRPELPAYILALASSHTTSSSGITSRIILGRVGYGDGR